MISTLMSWNSRRKMKILIKPPFWTFQYKSMIKSLQLLSVTKIMGTTALWVILYFFSLPSLNKVQKQWAKLASSYVTGASRYVMRSQHCIGGEGRFLNTLFKSPLIFSHGLSEIKRKRKDEVLCMLFQITQICWCARHAARTLS